MTFLSLRSKYETSPKSVFNMECFDHLWLSKLSLETIEPGFIEREGDLYIFKQVETGQDCSDHQTFTIS